MPQLWYVLLAVGWILAAVFLVWRPIRATMRETRLARVRQGFHGQREHLEAKFVKLAGARSDAPRWEDCDFDDDVAYVRNRTSGELSALVAVTVMIDAAEDSTGTMGDLVGNLAAGTAVFRLDRDHWETDGRAILNLSPAEAILFYRADLEVVEHESAARP